MAHISCADLHGETSELRWTRYDARKVGRPKSEVEVYTQVAGNLHHHVQVRCIKRSPRAKVMSAKAFVLSISLFWVVLHALKRIVPTEPSRQLILPLASRQRPRPQLESRLLSNPFYGRTHFTLRSLRLEIVTTGFSEGHDALSWKLRNGRLATLTRTIYDMGAFLGVFISVTSVVILSWMVLKLSREYVATPLTNDHSASSTMHGKRSGNHLAVNDRNSGTVIEPIVRLADFSCVENHAH
jgi:hypothetical protein